MLPPIAYPPGLAITNERERIVRLIAENQVLILCGQTGSGKTTQIPKMCLEAGAGQKGLIGCTQPRRIAALSVADRIAYELGNRDLVGTKIRFHDQTGPGNIIRVMTDGILLSEAQSHPNLRRYNTIIIDEAHERTLNIDVLLGMLSLLIRKRKELKLIITSATLDIQSFSQHFSNAPVVEVEGRTFPVDIRYCPPDEGIAISQIAASGVRKIMSESSRGDVLVFLPTEQDIRDTMKLISHDFGDYISILPLYARLPWHEQRRVFEPGGRRKIIIATNIAETSITIPSIKYVVDSGLARMSRYTAASKIYQLPVDKISRSSADQRAGRCGRVQNGICLRMYSQEDYNQRPEFTSPEIKRSDLADVILRLINLGISDIENFPFIDPPSKAGIRDGIDTLYEIRAISHKRERKLTRDGKRMAALPIAPRLARMLVQAEKENCLTDLLPIVAALSVQNPKETDRSAADFIDKKSDFITWLNLWDGFRQTAGSGSYSSRLKAFCTEHKLSFRRMREWMDVHRQLALIMEEDGHHLRRTANKLVQSNHQSIHRSILSGMLCNIGFRREARHYEAPQNKEFFIHPGSALKKCTDSWLVYAQLVRTSRLFAHTVAVIQPQWLEDLADHLINRKYVAPHWDADTCTVMAREQIRLYGFLINDSNRIPYGAVNPAGARQIFINSYLIENKDSPETVDYMFLKNNRDLIRDCKKMEQKLRRNDIVAGEDQQLRFYDQHLPKNVFDIATLNKALKEDVSLEERLCMSKNDVLIKLPATDHLKLYPDTVNIAGQNWKITYAFDPHSGKDGATLQLPAGGLSLLTEDQIDWLVPGMLEEKIEKLIRTLPKMYRRNLIPISETLQFVLENIDRNGNLLQGLSKLLESQFSIQIPIEAWDRSQLPAHLKMRFCLLDDTGNQIACSENREELRAILERQGGAATKGPTNAYKEANERIGMKEWPQNMERMEIPVKPAAGILLWPAFVDEGQTVSLRFYDLENQAVLNHRHGLARLGQSYWKKEIASFKRQIQLDEPMIFPDGLSKTHELLWERVFLDVFAENLIYDRTEWERHVREKGRTIYTVASRYFQLAKDIFKEYTRVNAALVKLKNKSHRKNFLDSCSKEALQMVGCDFILRDSIDMWQAMPKWLKALEIHGRRGNDDPSRVLRFETLWSELNLEFEAMLKRIPVERQSLPLIRDARTMLQELRVSITASGELKSAGKISEKKARGLFQKIKSTEMRFFQ